MSELRQAVAESYRSIPLPEGWQVKDFADVVFLQEGPGIRKYEYAEDGYPMINVRCVQDGYIDMSSSKCANLELATNKWKHFQIDEGDILFTISGTIGRSAIVLKSDLPLLMNTSVVRFKSLDKDLDVKFLYHTVRSHDFIKSLKDQATGTAIKNVGPSHLKKLQISYPPLEKQKQIVAVLDEAFAAIDLAKANVEKNLQNAKELFQSKLNQIFTQKGDDWEDTTLGEIAEFKNGLNYNQHSKGQTLPIVGVGDFQKNLYVPMKKLELATIDGQLDVNYEVKKDDILTVRSNGSKHLIGRCMLVPEVGEQTSFSGFIIRIRFRKTEIAPKFLLWFMKSKSTVERLTSGGGGANINNINQKKLATLPIVFPPLLCKQLKMAGVLDSLSEEIVSLEAKYSKELDSLANLKKSMLQKVFVGKLGIK